MKAARRLISGKGEYEKGWNSSSGRKACSSHTEGADAEAVRDLGNDSRAFTGVGGRVRLLSLEKERLLHGVRSSLTQHHVRAMDATWPRPTEDRARRVEQLMAVLIDISCLMNLFATML